MCGTPEYLAPEVILGKRYGREVDWWALGVLIYEMSAGAPPFFSDSPMLIYQQILKMQVFFPPSFPAKLRSLVSGLLTPQPERRLCGLPTLKTQGYFAQVDFDEVGSREAPWRPALKAWTECEQFSDVEEETTGESC